MEKFSDRLKELRLDKGLTQFQLAEKIGVNRVAVTRWELGDRTPDLDMLILLAKFFNCSLGYLAGIEQ